MLHTSKAFQFANAIAIFLVMASCAPLGAQEVLLTPEKALKEIFPESVRSVVETRSIPDSFRKSIQKRLGHAIEDSLTVSKVFDRQGELSGYAVISEEIGKYRPITFMVGVTADMRVKDVAVLVYRESRGGDVKRKRFLGQYRGKSTRDPIDIDRDIINISGATISVRSMNYGVKRVLAEVSAVYASK